jgi:hypothetical protein
MNALSRGILGGGFAVEEEDIGQDLITDCRS